MSTQTTSTGSPSTSELSPREASSGTSTEASPGTSTEASPTTSSPGASGRPAARKIAVHVSNVTKRFGGVTAVDRVSLEIPAGAVVGLIGPNGAGKTTTFSMMAGFLKPTEGIVEVLGHAPSDVAALRSRLGVLPQDALLPSFDGVGDFLVHMGKLQGMSRAEAESSSRKVLAEVGGSGWWSMRCGSLSHGMAKRVQLAQALLGDPEVVLLDEPTAGLDPRVAYEVRNLVKSRKGRCTLVVSSHNLQELEEICDEAAILDRGRLVASGSIGELTSASEEIHVKLAAGPVPTAIVRELPVVKRVAWDEERRDLVVYFDRGGVDAETVIGHVLWALLQNQARISGVTKGRKLEQRVMELTE